MLRKLILGRSLMLAMVYCGCALAQSEGDAPGFSLRGFGTLGVARSSSEHAEFVRDLSQPVGIKNGRWSGRIDSLLGVQANWRASTEWELVGQAVGRLRYNGDRDPELMWAFAKWDPDARFSLRTGRIGADFMMLADSRLVGYSYLPARPSSDFFGPLFFSHFDGADFTLTLPLGTDLIRAKLFSGETREKTSGAPGVWDTSGSALRGGVLDYQSGPWLVRGNVARARFSNDVNIAPLRTSLREAGLAMNAPAALAAADALGTAGTVSQFFSLGIVYDEGPLFVQGMVNRIRHQTSLFEDSHAAYLLAGYRIGSVTPYAGVSSWRTRFGDPATGLPNSPPFDELNALYGRLLRASHVDQKTITLGVRWDIGASHALKLQWDALRGTADSRFSYARSDLAWNGRTNVLSAVLDFVF